MNSPLIRFVLLNFLILLGTCVSLLPRRLVLAVGAGMGRVLMRLGWRRELVGSNLLMVFPGATPEMQELRSKLERGFFDHFGRLFLEILVILSPRWKRWVSLNVVMHGVEHWQRAHALGRGVLFVSNHLGNWEAMAAGMAQAGADVLIVTKHLKPEWLHERMAVGRLSSGVKGTYEPKTLRDVLSQLKRGGTVGFVIDQYAGPPIGIRVPFFGVPVGTLSAPAVVARRTEAAVLPVHNFRDADGRLHVIIGEAFGAFQEGTHRELASQLALWVSETEKSVRQHPAQWLWSHRRFKGDLSPLDPQEWDSPRERS